MINDRELSVRKFNMGVFSFQKRLYKLFSKHQETENSSCSKNFNSLKRRGFNTNSISSFIHFSFLKHAFISTIKFIDPMMNELFKEVWNFTEAVCSNNYNHLSQLTKLKKINCFLPLMLSIIDKLLPSAKTKLKKYFYWVLKQSLYLA